MKKLFLFLIPLFVLAACKDSGNLGENPAADGFDQQGSDSLAIAWADAVMRAQGGRKAWDDTRFISWNFFGKRQLLWDKKKGRVRIEVPDEQLIYLINLNEEEGRVQMGGKEVSDKAALKELTDKGKQIWVNDSYWLVMPYKLKDSGVTLTHVGQDTMPGGRQAEVLELRFKEVGYTPQNKYQVYIDPADSLVKAWAYFENAQMKTPNFITPWQDYQRHGNILLSGDRGERKITDIKVMEQVEDKVFEEF